MIDLKELLFELSSLDGCTAASSASDKAYEILSSYVKTEKTYGLGFVGYIKGESDYTLMLDAHIDQIGMVVTNVDDEGFLTVSKAGGIDLRALPARNVTVHGKEKVSAVFCSTPPHLAKDEVKYDDVSKLKIDTLLGKRAKEIISAGDTVTFCSNPVSLLGSKVSGHSFDNRAGVVCLLKLAQELSKEKLPVSVVFSFSDSEELGLRGIRPNTYKVNPQEAIVIDVTFGDAPQIPSDECGKLGKGAMIGVSPVLDKKISNKLMDVAKENNIDFQIEAMGERTGTNADMVSITREGVKTATLSIPLRNMHTDVEVVDLKDLETTVNLLKEYIIKGGIQND